MKAGQTFLSADLADFPARLGKLPSDGSERSTSVVPWRSLGLGHEGRIVERGNRMNRNDLLRAGQAAESAARDAGALMRRHLNGRKVVQSATPHDLKLALDVRCQKLIQRSLAAVFPDVPVLGEEGGDATTAALARWVVDPIDGTVNYAYGIPHACVSIALQTRVAAAEAPLGRRGQSRDEGGFRTVVGVVYDPFCDELWTATAGRGARLNGRPIRVSDRGLREAVISLGFGKQAEVLEYLAPAFTELVHRVRKVRIMGAAALALCYVACGRFDAFLEPGLRLWDIAAGGFIVECAAGRFWRQPLEGELRYAVHADNGRLGRSLRRFALPGSE